MERSTRRRKYLFVALSVSGLFILGIGAYLLSHTPGSSGQHEKLRLADGTSPGSAPVYVALEKGYFEQEGLEISFSMYPSGKAALEAVIHGEADLSTVSDTPFAFAVMKGERISIIATLANIERLVAIVARKDQGISSPEDLRGKDIGVTEGTGAQFFLDSFLLFRRIPKREVRFSDVPPENMADALRKGEVQAVATWDPVWPRLQKEFGEKTVIFHDDRIYTMIWNLVGLQNFVQKNPKAVQKVLRALMKAEDFIKEMPEEARRIAARYLNTQASEFEKSWSFCRFRLSLDGTLLQTLEDQTRWAIKNKFAERKEVPNYLDHIHFEGMKSVRPDAVHIVH